MSVQSTAAQHARTRGPSDARVPGTARRCLGPVQWCRRPAGPVGTARLESTRGPTRPSPVVPWGGLRFGPSVAPWGAPLTHARHFGTAASYFARHRVELAGVLSEAAPPGGFGVPGELLCSAFNHSSCTPGPERRARPSLLPPHRLSAATARLRARPGGPAQDTPPRARVRTPPGLLPAVTGYAAPCSG